MKRLIAFLVAGVATLLSGCVSYDAYFKAMEAKVKADALVEVAKAEERTAKWDALARASEGSDVGRAVLGAVAAGDKAGRAEATPTTVIEPPRDPLDRVIAVVDSVSRLTNSAANVIDVRERNKTQREVAKTQADRDVRVEEARQNGEGTRLRSVTEAQKPNVTNVRVGGDLANNGSTISKPNCPTTGGQGGQAAPGGAANQGNVTGGSSATTPASTGGQSGAAGAGGSATGGCK